ncbi:MAG: spinster family MFS transporter [Myxococcales bacterium]
MSAGAAGLEQPAAGRRGSLPFAALAVLTAINLLNYADRYVLAGAQELIKADPGIAGGLRDAAGRLTDASLGTLAAAFFVVYMIASPFTGFLGDRFPRKYLIAAGVLLWSLATFASGLATSFTTLLVARAFIGIGEAGYAAASPSLIADLFDKGWRGKAVGIFYVAIPVGSALGFAAGGMIGAAWGWRSAFFVAGVPGLVLALVALLLREPERGAHDEASDAKAELPSPREIAGLLRGNRGWLVATIGQTLMTFAVGGLASWMPSFLVRFAGLSQGEAGLFFGAITAVAGLLGTIAGTLAGEWATRRRPDGYLLVSGVSLAAAAPLLLAVAAHPGRGATLALTFAALFLVMLNTGPLNTAIINSVPARIRASAMATTIFVIHLFGDAISPTLVGMVSDWSKSLAVAVAACALPLFLGGLVLTFGGRPPSQRLPSDTPRAAAQ